MKIEITNVTPSMASEFLTKNNSNRKINKKHLDMIKRVMISGKWKLNHQGVAFYENGNLADGQHRLMAICDTGVTVTMPVFYGIESDIASVTSIDCGRARTAIDGSTISGINISNKDLVFAKGYMYGYEANAFLKMTHEESIELCKNLCDEIKICNMLFRKHVKHVTIAPVKVAVVKAVKSGVPFGVAESFVYSLTTGEYTNRIMANAIKLRNKLMQKNMNGGHDRSTAYEMTFNTINKTNSGIKVERIR